MFLLKFLWAVIAHPAVLIAVALAVAALVGYGFWKGWPAAIKVLLDMRTWIVVAIVLLMLSVSSLKQENTDLKAKVDSAVQVETAKTDAAATLTVRSKAKDRRTSQTQRLDEVIRNAEPNHAVDDVLDEIATLRADGAPAGRGADDKRLRDDSVGAIVP